MKKVLDAIQDGKFTKDWMLENKVNQPSFKAMRKKCDTGFMYAVDIADHLSRDLSLPFRECYHILSKATKLSKNENYLRK